MPMEPSKRIETGSIKVEVNTSRSLYWREQDTSSSSSSSSTSNLVSSSSAGRYIPQAQRHPESRERWGYDISTSAWLPSQTYTPEPKEPVPLEMASGFHGSASPIAEAFERENSSSTEDYLIHSRKGKSVLRDPRLEYQPSPVNISEYNSIQRGHRRSGPTIPRGHVDFSLDSTLATSSSTPATATSTSSCSTPATPLKWRSSKIPIPPPHSSSTHEAQSEFRYFCRNGRGKRPVVSSVSRHISTMSGMSAQVCHTDSNTLDSSQSPDSRENLHPKRSSQQRQQHREQNEKQLKQQKQYQQQQQIQNHQQQNHQQQQTQQQNLKEDLRAVDFFAAHYSTSHDRIIRPSPISYHHFKPSPEIVHEPRHHRPKSPKIVNLNLSQSESQISQQNSSSSSLPSADPSNPSSSSTLCALSSSSSLDPPPETSNSLRPFVTHPRGTVTQVDFPLHQASELPEISSQHTLGTSRPTSPLSTTRELLPQGSPCTAATSILNPTVGTKPSLASHQMDTIEILNEEESQNEAQSPPPPTASYLTSQSTPFLRSSNPIERQNRSHSQWVNETIPEPPAHPRHSATLPPVSPLGSGSILDAVLAAGDGNRNGASANASANATVASSGMSMNTRTNMNTGSNITSVSNFPFTTISSDPVSLGPNTGMEWESETANAGPYVTLNVVTTATSAEDRRARSRSFGQRLRDTFWFKSKKRKQD